MPHFFEKNEIDTNRTSFCFNDFKFHEGQIWGIKLKAPLASKKDILKIEGALCALLAQPILSFNTDFVNTKYQKYFHFFNESVVLIFQGFFDRKASSGFQRKKHSVQVQNQWHIYTIFSNITRFVEDGI